MAFSNTAKKRVKIRASSKRTNAENDGTTRVYSIDNRRANDFASVLHAPTEITTSDELWGKLQDKIRAAKTAVEAQAATDRLKSLSAAFYDAMRNINTLDIEDLELPDLPTPTIRDDLFHYDHGLRHTFGGMRPLGRSLFRDMYWDTGPQLDMINLHPHYYPKIHFTDEEREQLKETMDRIGDLLAKIEPANNRPKPKIEIEPETNFHERSRYRLVANDEMPEGWNELQASLPPSLLDEDCLGGFGDWMLNMPDDVQFLLIGDTNHYNPEIRDWCDEATYLESLKAQGIQDLVLELPFGINPILQSYFDGNINGVNKLKASLRPLIQGDDEAVLQAIDKISAVATKAKSLGIRLHAFDEHVLDPTFDKKSPRDLFRRISQDAFVASRIKEAVSDRKTAIIYGAGHYSCENSLIEQLGEEKSRVIDLYSDLEDYKSSPTMKRRNAKHVAPYAFIIDKETVIATRGSYTRTCASNFDGFTANMKMGAQEAEVENFMDRVRETYKSIDNPDLYGVDPAHVVTEAYWVSRALSSGFSQAPRFEVF